MAAAREGRAVIPVMMHLLLGRLWQDFIARLAALVPKPGARQFRYHGVFAPASPDRARVVPRTRAAVAGECGEASVTDRQRALALTWAQRLKRVLAIEIETCRRCGGRLRVIASSLGLRPDPRAFIDGTRRFAQHITPDPHGSALTSGLGGCPSRLGGSTSGDVRIQRSADEADAPALRVCSIHACQRS